jgi:hypothetical protein
VRRAGLAAIDDAPAQIESWTPETRRLVEIYILDRGKIPGIRKLPDGKTLFPDSHLL